MLYDVKGKIVINKPITQSVNYLELSMPKIPAKLEPGHFLHIRLMHTNDPLLRRPLSVNRVVSRKIKGKVTNNVGIVYKIVGKGTSLLKEMAVGESVDVLGPLGNGFDLGPVFKNKQNALLVSGGMGVAPLIFLAQFIKKKNKNIKIEAFIGMDTKKELICLDDLKKLGCKINISTDDGSQGFKGYVSDMLEKYLFKQQSLNPAPYVYACGPKPMLKALQKTGEKFQIPGQVSLDEMMGCGIGACLGCVINTRDLEQPGRPVYKRICKDGPVFDINQIIWED
jgi:dihydroorotate dehydrogenase electron transfer subunit